MWGSSGGEGLPAGILVGGCALVGAGVLLHRQPSVSEGWGGVVGGVLVEHAPWARRRPGPGGFGADGF